MPHAIELLSLLPLVAFAYLAAMLAMLGMRKPGYRHVGQTISEIGEVGAPDQKFVAYGLFLPIGLALAAMGFAMRGHSNVVALAYCIAVGYLVAALFPCDPGSPVSGTARQGVHNLGGAVEYIGGGMSLMVLGEQMSPAFQVGAFAVWGAAVALTVLPVGVLRGLVQRVAETVLFGCLAWAAWLATSGGGVSDAMLGKHNGSHFEQSITSCDWVQPANVRPRA